MTGVEPFRIDIDQEVLDDLAQRLERTRWPEAETVDDWSQGLPLSYARDLAEYWAHSYDWSTRQARLNAFDQFKTNLDGLDIHFIHQRSPHDDAFPLVMTHGWPGSVAEFVKVIGPLTDPTAHGGRAEDAFHVVCPALPGYGFSEKPTKPGWNVDAIASAWDKLMVRLRYQRYGAQGGDWGALVTTRMGSLAEHCCGIHLNMAIAQPPKSARESPTPAEAEALAAGQHYRRWDSGYSKQQSTRPQTLGYGLVDSPVGQMAWIVEKFWAWMDCDGHPENVLDRDELLDNVMLYWLTASGASSARLYWESFRTGGDSEYVDLPTAIAAFPKEVLRVTRPWAEQRYNVKQWTEMTSGGHFAALEQPAALVEDIAKFFRGLRT